MKYATQAERDAARKEARRRANAKFRSTPEGRAKVRALEQARTRKPDFVRHTFARNLKMNFGITVEDYARILHAQDFKCVCGGVLEHGTFRVHVDHCHRTGLVRGVLCYGCNVALGMVKDSPATLRILAKYLERVR